MPDGTSPLQESPETKSDLCWRSGPPCVAICHGVMPTILLQKKRLRQSAGGEGELGEARPTKKLVWAGSWDHYLRRNADGERRTPEYRGSEKVSHRLLYLRHTFGVTTGAIR